MTDHLDEAAAKAVDLAEELNDERGDTLSVKAAAHLAYMAGLLRGGAAGTYSPGRSGLQRGAATDEPVRFYPSTGSYDKVQVAPRTALDSDVEQERDRFRAQRDDLLSAAKDAVSVAEDLVPGLVLDRLREAIDRVDGRV